MSQENVELLRAFIERWNAGDHSFGGVAAYCDPAVELESPFSSVVGEPYRGYAGMESWMSDMDEQFSEWRIGVDDLREGGNAVIAIGAVHARGRASDLVVQRPFALVAYFGSDDRITRARIFQDVNEALEAAGLAE